MTPSDPNASNIAPGGQHPLTSPALGEEAQNPEINPSPSNEIGMLDLEAVQRALNRSRASIYRYANTDPVEVNPAFDPKRLNPEYRKDPREALMFHPNEVARFAQDVLKIKQVTVEVLSSPHTATQQLLEALLEEMRAIRQLLETGQVRLPQGENLGSPTNSPSQTEP